MCSCMHPKMWVKVQAIQQLVLQLHILGIFLLQCAP